jgi:hypothetical protein
VPVKKFAPALVWQRPIGAVTDPIGLLPIVTLGDVSDPSTFIMDVRPLFAVV